MFVIMKYKEYIGMLQCMGSLQCSHQDAYNKYVTYKLRNIRDFLRYIFLERCRFTFRVMKLGLLRIFLSAGSEILSLQSLSRTCMLVSLDKILLWRHENIYCWSRGHHVTGMLADNILLNYNFRLLKFYTTKTFPPLFICFEFLGLCER